MKLPTLEQIRAERTRRAILAHQEATRERIPGPQAGPQAQFLASRADIAIYGGAAGGGKTWALLMEPLSHIDNPGFGGVIFRRTTVQVRNEGGLWDESAKMYPLVGGVPKEAGLWWKFPKGASISFAHIEYEKNILDWQGAQIPFIGYDELTHFSEKQFWYLLSRNRSMCGVKPYIRATCNPDADSWVAKLIAWWIDQETGFPIKERSGILRWFVRINDRLIWADSAAELEAAHPGSQAKSLTFVPALLSDNAALMAADPNYRANLLALPRVERERLLQGNWKVRDTGSGFFIREWFPRFAINQKPANLNIYGTSDYAVTEDGGDFTVHRIWGLDPDGDLWMLDGWRGQTSADVWIERQIDLILQHKPLAWFGESGVIAKTIEPMLFRRLRERKAACRLEWLPSIADKPTRARGIQSRAAMKRVHLPEGVEGDGVLEEYAQFPAGRYDDEVDNASLIGRALDQVHPAIVKIRINNPNPPDLGMFRKNGDTTSWKVR